MPHDPPQYNGPVWLILAGMVVICMLMLLGFAYSLL